MIPRRRPVEPAPEAAPVEWELVQVVDRDFHFAGCPPLLLRLVPGDVVTEGDGAVEVVQTAGAVEIVTTIPVASVVYEVRRTYTVRRPKPAHQPGAIVPVAQP